jgi:hypothetical protein
MLFWNGDFSHKKETASAPPETASRKKGASYEKNLQ